MQVSVVLVTVCKELLVILLMKKFYLLATDNVALTKRCCHCTFNSTKCFLDILLQYLYVSKYVESFKNIYFKCFSVVTLKSRICNQVPGPPSFKYILIVFCH